MLDALQRYPKKLPGNLTVRPMEARDEAALLEFFRRMPVQERQLFKDDVTDPAVIQGWARSLNYANILPLLLFDGNRLVADATLHRDRRGWSRHVAKVRLSIDSDYRRRGLGKVLVKEVLDLARPLGIAVVDAEILGVQTGATRLFEDLGFVCVATLPQHAFDLAGRVHDIVVYSHTVTPPEKLSPEASLAEHEADVGGDA